MKPLLLSFISIALFPAGIALAAAPGASEQTETAKQLSAMTAAQKKQGQEYFTAHSFDFSSIFKKHHPGPYWILKKKNQFQLSSAQIKKQDALKNAMAKNTLSGNAALKKAYEKYATDAAATEPSLAGINRDIDAIGKAQTHLAKVMVPYHLEAYRALSPAQQALYRKLVAEQK